MRSTGRGSRLPQHRRRRHLDRRRRRSARPSLRPTCTSPRRLDGWVIGSGFAGARALPHGRRRQPAGTPVPDFQGALRRRGLRRAERLGCEGRRGPTSAPSTTARPGSRSCLPGSPSSVADLDFYDASIGYAVGGVRLRRSQRRRRHELADPADARRRPISSPTSSWSVPTSCGSARPAASALYSATGGQNWAVMDAGAAGFGSFSAIAAAPGGRRLDGRLAGHDPALRGPAAAAGQPAAGRGVHFLDHRARGRLHRYQHRSTTAPSSAGSGSFGDGATSTEQNPTHVFAAADTYIVRLTVTDDDGDHRRRGRGSSSSSPAPAAPSATSPR